AHARFNQHGLFSGADEQRVKPRRHIVLFVGGNLASPHDLGDDTKKRAAVERVSAVGKDAELEIAESEAGHGVSLPQLQRVTSNLASRNEIADHCQGKGGAASLSGSALTPLFSGF